jgi:hypothetical protein
MEALFPLAPIRPPGLVLTKDKAIPEGIPVLVTKRAAYLSIIYTSLFSDGIFKLRPYEKAKQGRTFVISLPVIRRSLYITSGYACTTREHNSTPVKTPHCSIALRTLQSSLRYILNHFIWKVT